MTQNPATAADLGHLPARRLMGWPELTSLCVAFATLVMIVSGSIWLAERTGDALSLALSLEHRRAVSRQLLIEVQTAETGQRGFLLTGKEGYLAPYDAARRDIPALIGDLGESDATEAGLIARLRHAIDGKMSELTDTVASFLAGHPDAAMARVQTGEGEQLMTTIRELTASIGRDEGAALIIQVDLVQSRRRMLVAVEIAGLLVVLLMAALIAFGIRSYVLAMRASGRSLSLSNERLVEANQGLDEQVRDRTADLQTANDEIQRFAYIVSHDLRAPLVNIMGFTSELEQATALLRQHAATHQASADVLEAAEADIPEAIGFIKASTGKMDRLINAILHLSREGRRVMAAERLDMTELCQDIVAALRHQAMEKGAEVTVGSVPSLWGDRVAVEQVFTNIIDNALKYLKPGRPGQIRVEGRLESGMARFDIIDNGRGIAGRDHERVFELFRRAGDQSVPGEGIGLAHVRALVRRMGGSIDYESALDVGTTFTVWLPQKPKSVEDSH